MKVATKPYGVLDVDERQKIHFPFGLLGFENLSAYALLDARQQPFYWLQSLDSVDVAFVLIDPKLFRCDYVLEVAREELDEIGIQSPDDVLHLSIVTIPDDPRQMTANLQGPIIVNKRTRVGRQSITTNPKWQIRHAILEELSCVRQETC